jgi:hypothetical protein
MPALPEAPALPNSPATPGEPNSPSTSPPFGEPAGETIYTNAPSHARAMPTDPAHPNSVLYLVLAVVLILAIVFGSLAALGRL